MSKKFFSRKIPISIEIEDINGNVHKMDSIIVNFTPDITDEIEKLAFDTSKTSSSRLISQMITIFGKDEEFYKNFDMPMLGEVIGYIAEEIYAKKNK